MTPTPTSGAPVKTWTIDRVRSIAEFGAKRLAVATTRGQFSWVEGTLCWDEAAPAWSWWTVAIDVPRARAGEPPIAGNQPLRRLNQPFHTITFRSTRVERLDALRWRVVGNMTFGEVTREVALVAMAMDPTRDGCGRERVTFCAEATLGREDLGVDWEGFADPAGGPRAPIQMTLHLSLAPSEDRGPDSHGQRNGHPGGRP